MTPTVTPDATLPSSPCVRHHPGQVDFGQQLLDAVSKPQSIIVLNLGLTTLFISNVSLTPANPGDFSLNNRCAGLALRQAEFCTSEVSLAPTVIGLRQASLLISDNAANSPQTVLLSGMRVLSRPPHPIW
ncbi:MAG: choice-of-anchor D domain-containing protein [Anaerolineae bacterium]